MQDHLLKIGKKIGIEFAMDRSTRVPNTELSHRLIKLYPKQQKFLQQKIFEAYFVNSRDIGDIEVLVDIASELGIDPKVTKNALKGDDKRDEV